MSPQVPVTSIGCLDPSRYLLHLGVSPREVTCWPYDLFERDTGCGL